MYSSALTYTGGTAGPKQGKKKSCITSCASFWLTNSIMYCLNCPKLVKIQRNLWEYLKRSSGTGRNTLNLAMESQYSLWSLKQLPLEYVMSLGSVCYYYWQSSTTYAIVMLKTWRSILSLTQSLLTINKHEMLFATFFESIVLWFSLFLSLIYLFFSPSFSCHIVMYVIRPLGSTSDWARTLLSSHLQIGHSVQVGATPLSWIQALSFHLLVWTFLDSTILCTSLYT